MKQAESMTYAEFSRKLGLYKDALRRAYKLKAKRLLKPQEKWARDGLNFVRQVEKSMMDEHNHNFARWLKLEKCSFVHPGTGETVSFDVPDDHEAIYNFLLLCKMFAKGEEPDDGFVSYLGYLLSRDGEEGC